MKKYIIAAAAMLASAAFSASAYDYSLQVNFNDGKSAEFQFASTPVATFADGEMTITQNGAEKTTYVMSNVQDMKILRTGTGITDITAGDVRPSFSIEGGVLTGRGAVPCSQAAVYNMAGAMMASAVVDESGSFTVAVDRLPKGIYVVSAAGVQFKFIK